MEILAHRLECTSYSCYIWAHLLGGATSLSNYCSHFFRKPKGSHLQILRVYYLSSMEELVAADSLKIVTIPW